MQIPACFLRPRNSLTVALLAAVALGSLPTHAHAQQNPNRYVQQQIKYVGTVPVVEVEKHVDGVLQGTFTKTGPTTWLEKSAFNSDQRPWQVASSDPTGVVLKDGPVTVRLNFLGLEATYSGSPNEQPRKLYDLKKPARDFPQLTDASIIMVQLKNPTQSAASLRAVDQSGNEYVVYSLDPGQSESVMMDVGGLYKNEFIKDGQSHRGSFRIRYEFGATISLDQTNVAIPVPESTL